MSDRWYLLPQFSAYGRVLFLVLSIAAVAAAVDAVIPSLVARFKPTILC